MDKRLMKDVTQDFVVISIKYHLKRNGFYPLLHLLAQILRSLLFVGTGDSGGGLCIGLRLSRIGDVRNICVQGVDIGFC